MEEVVRMDVLFAIMHDDDQAVAGAAGRAAGLGRPAELPRIVFGLCAKL